MVHQALPAMPPVGPPVRFLTSSHFQASGTWARASQPQAFRLCGSSAWGAATSSRAVRSPRKAPRRGAGARRRHHRHVHHGGRRHRRVYAAPPPGNAMLTRTTRIRTARASSAGEQPGRGASGPLLLAGDIGECPPVGVADYEAGIGLLDLPQRREAATRQLLRPVGQRQQSNFFP